ncbi:MAG: cell division protein ZapA [Oscillospiraceae bacterium]|nr:cell division protein ZapA [Oscillospiraceae bacterium]
MENRITVNICGTDYTFTAEESPSYMQKVAALVDTRMSEILKSGRINRVDAAVLAAANIADDLLKEQASAENLRNQLKDYLDEANKAKAEASDLRREIFKLQQRLDKK